MKKDIRDELDERLKEKVRNHECICEPELLERIHDILIENDILENDIQDYHDKLKETSDINKSKIRSIGEYIKERMSDEKRKVPEFDEGYVVLDSVDNHVLDNAIFSSIEDANSLKEEYLNQMPSLVENEYVVMKVTHDCLEYGAFPYEKTLYFIYDIEK